MLLPDLMHRTRLLVAMSFIFGFSAIFLALLREDIVQYFHINPQTIFIAIVACILYTAAPLLMLYLRGSIRIRQIDDLILKDDVHRDPMTEDLARSLEILQKEMRNLRHELATRGPSESSLSDDDKVLMLKALREQFAETLFSEKERRDSVARAERFGLLPVRRSIESAGLRLREELGILARRGNLNLVIGTLTTLVAVGLLIYMVLSHDAQITSLTELLSYYIPRVSTVVFIEIFGFFFLRLYKDGLIEMKYYQNELTTLSVMGIAIEIAAQDAQSKGYGDLPRILAECDRNRSPLYESGSKNDNEEVLERAATVIQELSKLIPGAGK